MRALSGRMPERPKGAVCKIAGDAYGGSNPPPPPTTGCAQNWRPLTSENSLQPAAIPAWSRTSMPRTRRRSRALGPHGLASGGLVLAPRVERVVHRRLELDLPMILGPV